MIYKDIYAQAQFKCYAISFYIKYTFIGSIPIVADPKCLLDYIRSAL